MLGGSRRGYGAGGGAYGRGGAGGQGAGLRLAQTSQ